MYVILIRACTISPQEENECLTANAPNREVHFVCAFIYCSPKTACRPALNRMQTST